MRSDNGEDEASSENLRVWLGKENGKRKTGGKKARKKAQEGMGQGKRRTEERLVRSRPAEEKELELLPPPWSSMKKQKQRHCAGVSVLSVRPTSGTEKEQ